MPCCDHCDPSVLARVAPPPHEKQRRVTKPRKSDLNEQLKLALIAWREEVCERDYPHAFWTPDAFLDDDTIESIASRLDIGNESHLAAVLRPCWRFWGQYGRELLAQVQKVVPKALPAPAQGCQRRAAHQSHQAAISPDPSQASGSGE